MAFRLRKVGSNVTGAFSTGLAEGPDLGEEYLPNSSYHLPAYIISLKDLLNVPLRQDIEKVAREVAWQCLAFSTSSSKVVVGEVSPLNKAPRPPGQVFEGSVKMTSLSHGDVVNAAFEKAKDLKGRQMELAQEYNISGYHQPRMLRIPGLLVTAVWLRADPPGGQDWIVPIHTKIPDLQNKEIYTVDEFVKITKPLAKACLDRPALE